MKKCLIAMVLIVLAATVYAEWIKCPIDSLVMTWTGKTRTEMGKMLHQYKCVNGHIQWIVQ